MTREGALPLLRGGRWYRSMDTVPVPGGRLLCLAPEIIVRDDAARLRARRPAVPDRARRLELLREAVELFRHGRVPVEGLGEQDPGDFAASMRETAGLPPALVRRWSGMLADRLEELAPGEQAGLTVVSLPANTFTCLEAVLEAALSGAAVWVRPSRREPLSSARLIGALLSAGWPAGALGYYPTAPRTLHALIQGSDRQIVYGGDDLAAELESRAAGPPSLDLRGPGRACVIVDGRPDAEELAARIAGDAGRFCTNTCVLACLDGTEPLGRRLAGILDGITLDPPDPRWPQASWPEPDAARVAAFVMDRLAPGGRLLTGRPVLSRAGGSVYLAPTLVEADHPGHPLVGHELPFPFAVMVATDRAGARGLAARSRFVHPAGFATSTEGVPS
ncbi:aldehyde dehydrogenase family protein [Nonomuraea sp. CA-218870]|uniref:aldehyde dehydrogenase family protein n=1 Tax=Nonomuraea sp. CA-218870 TaxID=3239998 RepID=UPI003D8AF95C